MSSAAAQQQLLMLLSQLPAGTNPYLAIDEYLKDQLFPSVPSSAVDQLYFLAAILGLTALLVLISLALRWRRGAFWVVRMHHSPRMLRPHATISWALIAVVMLVFFEVLLGYEVRFLHKAITPSFAYWLLLVWSLAWLGGHVAAWSLLVSFILHLHAIDSSFRAGLYAILANVGGVLTPVLYASVLLPLGCLGGKHYRDAIHHFQEIETLLQQGAKSWTPEAGFSILSLAPALPTLEKMQASVARFVTFFRATFIFYAITASLLVTYLVIIATLHVSSLRRMLAQATHDMSSSNNYEGPARPRNRQQHRVHRTLQSLTLTIGAFSFLGLFFTCIAIVASISPLKLITSPTYAQVVLLGPLWAFAVFGLPCAVLLIVRARDASMGEKKEAKEAEKRSETVGGSGGKPTGEGRGGPRKEGEDDLDCLPGARGEFSIHLEPLPPSTPASPFLSPNYLPASFGGASYSHDQDDQEKEKDDKARRPDWFSRSPPASRRASHSRRHSEDLRFSQSVSVHVDVDVVVEEDGIVTRQDSPVVPR
ncbi:hypothetical protein JCM8097_007978 [Rhodosporidiobolus ruineniae]